MALPLGRPPPSWPRLVVLFAAVSLVEGVSLSHITAFVPLHLPSLGVLEGDVPEMTGRVVAISSAVGIPFMPFWGALADRYARQPIIVRSFIFHFISLVIMLLAGNIWIFVIGRAVMSFSMGNTGLMMTTLTERVPASRTGLVFSVVNGAIPVGMLVGPLMGGPIVDAWGFRSLLMIDSAAMLGVILCMSLGYRDDFVGKEGRAILLMTADSFRIILGSPRLRVIFPALFLLFTGMGLSTIYTPIAITSLYTGSDAATAIGLVLAAGGVATLMLGPVMGTLADRFGHWRVLLTIVLVEVFLWSTPALAPNLAIFTIVWGLISGIASGGVAIAFSVLSSSASADVRGRVMSLSTLPLILGFMVGPAIGSVATRGSVFAIYPVAAAATLLSLGALVIAARQRPIAAEQPV